MVRGLAVGALVAVSVFVLGASLGIAQSPEEQVDARQNQMKTFGQSTKTISGFLKEGTGDMAAVQEAAAALEEGAQRLPTLFPEGTEQGVSDSRALPAIWERPDDFAQRIETLQAATADLTTAAESGDKAAVAAAFAPVGQACGGCHENFRLKKD